MAEHHPGAIGVASAEIVAGRAEAPEETSRTTTLSFDGPTRYREEAAGVQAGTRYVVRDGDRWASWDADWGAVTHETEQEGGPPSTTYALLLDPVAVIAAYRLENRGTTEVAGRPAHRLRAVARSARESAGAVVFQLGAGADELELAIDAERGALLRAEAFLAGEPFRGLEVTEIAFTPLPAETFAPALPPGAVPSRWQLPERLALHDLQARAPFGVFAPARVPDGWRLVESLFVPPREHPPVEAEVSLVYASPDGAYAVTVSQRAAGGAARGWAEWRADGDVEVADLGEHATPRHHVRVERDGTVVELSGSDASLLAELARTLAPAPTEPPRLDG
jgi:outer membrane lipoprotein-sorting protein